MKLHIYNPEHDTCLARNVEHFIIPKVALTMRSLYDHVPAYWADDGDWVVVDDVNDAQARLEAEHRQHAEVKFVRLSDLATLLNTEFPTEIVPWGWDRNIAQTLRKANPLLDKLIPDNAQLEKIRHLSSRVWVAKEFLPGVLTASQNLVGRMFVFKGTAERLIEIVEQNERLVLKAPWSSSGKGIRMIGGAITDNDKGWIRNVLDEQESIIIEPRYNKLLDFAMEFYIHKNYEVSYLGLSIFTTKGGTYQSNIVDTEENKLRIIKHHIPQKQLHTVKEKIIEVASVLFKDRYSGPFGVDMMAVDTTSDTALHPCVELNLRYTMGHAMILRR